MERKDPNAPTVLPTPPVVGDGVTDPRALGYAAGVAARRAGTPKYNAPVGGGSSPPIPLLDTPHQAGMTMADHARPLPQPAGGILRPQQASAGPTRQTFAMHPPPPQQPRPGPAATLAAQGIMPTDVLPEMARQDPNFRPGMGSMSAAAQPELALKYGVIRNGQPIPAQALQTGRAGLKQETVEGLKAVAEFNRTRQASEDALSNQEAQAEKDVAAGTAGAVARLADTPGMGVTEKEKPQNPLDRVDSLDLERFREMTMQDLLNNEEQRKIIEERCPPMSLAQLIMDERATQVVPISPGVLEPEFQSMSMEDELTIKRLIVKEAKALEVTDKYLLDKYSMMGLVVGLKAINKVQLPTHLDEEGHFNEALFWAKFNRVMRLPLHLVASLAINFFWFEVRVRRLHISERIKNG